MGQRNEKGQWVFTQEEQAEYGKWLQELRDVKKVIPVDTTPLSIYFMSHPDIKMSSDSLYVAVQQLGDKLKWRSAEQSLEETPSEIAKRWIEAGRVPVGLRTPGGKAMAVDMVRRMEKILESDFGNVWSFETLDKAVLRLQQQLSAKEEIDPNDSRLPGRASAFGKRTSEPEEHQTSDWEYSQRIQSMLGKLISSGYRAEAQKQSDAVKKLQQGGASLKEVHDTLVNNVAEWSALQEISKVIQGSFGKTPGEVATNRTTLVSWVKEAKAQGKSAVDLARLLTALLPKGKSGSDFIMGGTLTFSTDPSGNLTVQIPRETGVR